jgi:hypothetical protein
MDKSEGLETDTPSTEVMKPEGGPLYDPARFAPTAAVRLSVSPTLRSAQRFWTAKLQADPRSTRHS